MSYVSEQKDLFTLQDLAPHCESSKRIFGTLIRCYPPNEVDKKKPEISFSI